jgi:hypothetical protein
MVLTGCGGGSSAGAFRGSYAAAEPGLRSIEAGLEAAAASARGPVDRQAANRLQTLAARASQEGITLVDLNHPSRYNTRLRALGSTLEATARDLGNITAAASAHRLAAKAAATRALGVDAADVSSAGALMAGSLGLSAG